MSFEESEEFIRSVDESNKNKAPLDLSGDVYVGRDISNGCFFGANLAESHILCCYLGDDAYLSSADMKNAIIENSEEKQSKISSLSNAHLSNSEFVGFDFNGTKMLNISECSGAKFDRCSFEGVVTDALSAGNLFRDAFLNEVQKKDLVNSLDIKNTVTLLTTLDKKERKAVEELFSPEQRRGVSERFVQLATEAGLSGLRSLQEGVGKTEIAV